jgi:hypothetical protein
MSHQTFIFNEWRGTGPPPPKLFYLYNIVVECILLQIVEMFNPRFALFELGLLLWFVVLPQKDVYAKTHNCRSIMLPVVVNRGKEITLNILGYYRNNLYVPQVIGSQKSHDA